MEALIMDEETFKRSFWNLPSSQQYRCISSLITSSDEYFKWRLKNLISSIDTGDILSLLPPELQLHILSYVDGCSLLAACQVSKKWNKIIKCFDNLWKAKSMEIGVCIEDKPSNYSWIKAFTNSMRQLHDLKSGDAFCEKYINLQDKNNTVKAIDYNDGYICTVSDADIINIWILEVNVPVLTFCVLSSVSCVKFKPTTTLICGHFSGILSSWDLSELNDVCYQIKCGSCITPKNFLQDDMLLKNEFKLHTGPVFSCDFCEKIEVLVSGGGDKTIKFWNLRNGHHLRSLDTKGQWVLKVVLLPKNGNWNNVIAMTRDSVDKYQWPTNPAQMKYDDLEPNEYYKSLNLIELSKSVSLNECDDAFTIPGFQISFFNIGLIIQDLQEKYSILKILDLKTFNICVTVPLKFKVRKFLAMGKRFATFLTVGKALYTSSLVVVDITTGNVIGSQSIPHSKMTTPDGSQLVVGDTRWLHGLRGWEFYDDNKHDSLSCECLCKVVTNISNDLDNTERACSNCLTGTNRLGNINDSVNESNSATQKTLNSERKFLILASGLKCENGKFYSLWWRKRFDQKTKMD